MQRVKYSPQKKKRFYMEHDVWRNFRPLSLFVWYDSLRPINNLSVKQGRVFLGWTSTKLE